MIFETLWPNEALNRILSEEGPFITLYLPFGIHGVDGERLRVARKNALSALRDRVKQASDECWKDVLDHVEETLMEEAESQIGYSFPYTLVFIASSKRCIRTELAVSLRVHFSFAQFAEIEPLVYNEWASEPYNLIFLDLEGPELMKGHGYHCTRFEVEVPREIANVYGHDYNAYTLNRIINIGDRRRDGRTDLDTFAKAESYHGYSSRQMTDREKDIEYWARLIGGVLKTNISLNERCFVIGADYVCRRFKDLNKEFKISDDSILPHDIRTDQRRIIQTILERVTDEKLNAANSQFERDRPADNPSTIVQLQETGQLRKLYVQQADWFASQPVSSDDYESTNPRSHIIAQALKRHTQVEYTANAISNKHGLAGVPF